MPPGNVFCPLLSFVCYLLRIVKYFGAALLHVRPVTVHFTFEDMCKMNASITGSMYGYFTSMHIWESTSS